ncbi:hypothetical protein ACLOJK_012658 [Asimina triloba]
MGVREKNHHSSHPTWVRNPTLTLSEKIIKSSSETGAPPHLLFKLRSCCRDAAFCSGERSPSSELFAGTSASVLKIQTPSSYQISNPQRGALVKKISTYAGGAVERREIKRFPRILDVELLGFSGSSDRDENWLDITKRSGEPFDFRVNVVKSLWKILLLPQSLRSRLRESRTRMVPFEKRERNCLFEISLVQTGKLWQISWRNSISWSSLSLSIPFESTLGKRQFREKSRFMKARGVMGCLLLGSTGPPIKRRAGLRRKQAGRGSYREVSRVFGWLFVLSADGKCYYIEAVAEVSLPQHAMEIRSLLEAETSKQNLSHESHFQTNFQEKLLAWEDAYCDYPKPKDTMQHLSDNVSFKDMTGIISFGNQMDESNVTSAAYGIRLAVANMSCLLYALGEGVVGKVAFTGRHSWIFASEYSSKIVTEYPEEWQLQFAAGIKTILLVPVLHGVVQLGSLEMVRISTFKSCLCLYRELYQAVMLGDSSVMEDLMLVSHIKDLFNSLQIASGESSLSISTGGLEVPLPFPSPLLGDSSIPSAMISSLMDQCRPGLLKNNGVVVPDVVPTPASRMSTMNPNCSQLVMVEDSLQSAQKSMQHLMGTDGGCNINGNVREAICGALIGNSSVASHGLPKQSVNASHLDIYGNDIYTDFCYEEGLSVQPQFSAVNQLMSPKQSSVSSSREKDTKELQNSQVMTVNSVDACDLHSLEHIVDQPFGSVTSDQMLGCGFLNFSADSELHEALEPAFQKGYNACHWDPTVLMEDGFGASSLFCQSVLTEGTEPSASESDGLFWRGNGDEEHLLDAVVASVYDASKRTCSIRSPSSSSGQLAVSCQTQSRSEGGALAREDSGPWSFTKSALALRGDSFAASPTGSSSRTTSVLIDDGPRKLETGCVQSKKGLKLHQVSKRKGGAGDIQRPRPRDRQLIQDRVKELRELVPNSEKCSIDSLLERTIKHMLFLQCVTKQAEKLKQCKYPEDSGKEGQNSSSLALQRQQTDSTWAFDLGSQSGMCPIVVENLDQPGHMLVEMVCEEHGLFLEIAQVIRHLELTILKGVMEHRSNKIWAHFIVERLPENGHPLAPDATLAAEQQAYHPKQILATSL